MSQWVQTMETIVRSKRPALVGYAYLLVGSRAEAEDLVQEAIVRTFSRGRAKTSVAEAEAYIRRAIANQAINSARHRLVVEKHQGVLASSPYAPGHEAAIDASTDVEAALAVLSPRERAVVVLKYNDDLTIAAIAAILKLGEGTVKRYLANASAKLRPILGDAALDDASGERVPVAVMEGHRS